tara:strand:+ start:318 stop:707 length:390 start_codon:yes stop_codon:yes gene_type:complete
MKKSELKNIIKECVKEVIFEEGVLSGIITEVIGGLNTTTTLTENTPQAPARNNLDRQKIREALMGQSSSQNYEEVKQKFEDPSLFEGTNPIPSTKGYNPMSGVAPGDRGVDISNIPGFGNWGNVANNLK